MSQGLHHCLAGRPQVTGFPSLCLCLPKVWSLRLWGVVGAFKRLNGNAVTLLTATQLAVTPGLCNTDHSRSHVAAFTSLFPIMAAMGSGFLGARLRAG